MRTDEFTVSNVSPRDIAGGDFVQDFSVSSQDNNPQNVFVKPDGAKMYVVGLQNDKIYEYDLSTPWDVTSASFLQDFSVASQDTDPS